MTTFNFDVWDLEANFLTSRQSKDLPIVGDTLTIDGQSYKVRKLTRVKHSYYRQMIDVEHEIAPLA